jgi:hypothetical protein
MPHDEQVKIVELTSRLPLPNPLITGPLNLIGNGASGPFSGPAYRSLGPFGLIVENILTSCGGREILGDALSLDRAFGDRALGLVVMRRCGSAGAETMSQRAGII